MNITFGQLVALFGGWSIILVAIASWLGRMSSERLLSRWRRDEQALAENLRNVLANDRLMLETANRTFAAGQDVSQAKRLTAIEHLWSGVLRLRQKLSAPVFFFSILLPSEYDSAIRLGKPFAAALKGVTQEALSEAVLETEALESDRPYLGETLWLQFFVYRAFLGRLWFLVEEGIKTGHVSDWTQDKGVKQLLSNLRSSQSDEFSLASGDVTAINRTLSYLESIMLREISLIVSGKRSSLESFENAKELQSRLGGLSRSPDVPFVK